MKIRNGFVSNSSSGSFILHWRARTFGEEISIVEAIGKVFCVWFNPDTKEIRWEDFWNHEVKPKVEEIINATVKNVDGSFTTTFWTSMVNSPEDFGEAAKSLVMGIIANENGDFEIIDNKVQMDY